MKIFAVTVSLFLFPFSSLAQGFAGLGTDASGFAVPRKGTEFEFPRDHGPHPDFRIEWWYVTANLKSRDGKHYGLQWTLFRSALEPSDAPTDINGSDFQIWMAHAAVTTPETHYVAERMARGNSGQAGVTVSEVFEAWIDDWHMRGTRDLKSLELTAQGPDFDYDMQLSAKGPLVFQGDAGYSVKSSDGQASYYFSQPFFDIQGHLSLGNDQTVEVTGQAWLDREWSSQPLSDNQAGWDWFSLSFDDGAKMMGFLLRQTDDSQYSSATWIASDGTTTAFPDGAFLADALKTTQVAGRDVPTQWRVQLPEKNVDISLRALNPNAWMDTSVPYWEGPVIVEGSHNGRGYLEMTGY